MPAQDDRDSALIDAYLDLWQRNLMAFASEAAPEDLVSLVRGRILPRPPSGDGAEGEPS